MEGRGCESKESRRRRRLAAGRSGGVFERVQDGDMITYRYAWPERDRYHGDRTGWFEEGVESNEFAAQTNSRMMLSADTVSRQETLLLDIGYKTKDEGGNNEDNQSSTSSMPTKTAGGDVEPVETGRAERKRGRGRRAFKKMSQFASELMHGKKQTKIESKNIAAPEIVREQQKPRTLDSRILRSSSESPVKEQLGLEADHDPKQDEVNQEFFTPLRAKKLSTNRRYDEGTDSDVFE